MAQNILAGMTDYENQSLKDIVEDISKWISYSNEVKSSIEDKLAKLKGTPFYQKVPGDYQCMVLEMPQICQTNIDDFRSVLDAINSKSLTKEKVELFKKIGIRSISNGEDNKKYYKIKDEGYWHEYDNPDFRIVESIYAQFGDYCANLWDVLNAAHRLMDYVDTDKDVTSVKYEDNSIHIGDNNKISNSNFNSKIKGAEEKEKISSKVAWNIIVPLGVGIAVAAIAFWLGIN